MRSFVAVLERIKNVRELTRGHRPMIDDADGSDDDNLAELTWYDAAGRVIKRQGPQLTKTAYDRLGRQTRQYSLATTDDSVYADADDVSGDIVLEESQTVYEGTNGDGVLMQVTIERHHDDYGSGETTGALDTGADGDELLLSASNLEGRAQITAMWYDELDRLTDTVSFGTYGGSDFDRGSTELTNPPARSDTALRSTHAYNDDGTLRSITDPRNLETRYLYDDAGRQTVVIANYLNGTPSSATGDDDVHTRSVYTDGLRTKLWVDFDGDGAEDAGVDQVTTYTFGTVKGTGAGDSKIATGHLLREVKYPDSAGASDVVSHAYNAQSQEIYCQGPGKLVQRQLGQAGPPSRAGSGRGGVRRNGFRAVVSSRRQA
jgi:YD repeat-containing protein